jgi:hypothetical protein
MAGIWSTRLMAGLITLFNLLALNLVLLAACLPVVTIPAAIGAASTALDRWRRDGEDRVVREFIAALRASPPVHATVVLGVPLAVVVLGLAEARHFARDGIVLGVVAVALVITLMAVGYVIELPGRTGAVDTWSLAARLAVRNLPVTGPLYLAEIAAATALTMIDPGLLLLGLPVLLLTLLKRTARLGLNRAGLTGA